MSYCMGLRVPSLNLTSEKYCPSYIIANENMATRHVICACLINYYHTMGGQWLTKSPKSMMTWSRLSLKWLICECGNLVDMNITLPDSKVHGANMGPIWGQQDPVGPHVDPMNFAIWVTIMLVGGSHFTGMTQHTSSLNASDMEVIWSECNLAI